MVTRIAYDEKLYKRPEECIAAIAGRVAEGWQVSSVRQGQGTYVVLFCRERGE